LKLDSDLSKADGTLARRLLPVKIGGEHLLCVADEKEKQCDLPDCGYDSRANGWHLQRMLRARSADRALSKESFY